MIRTFFLFFFSIAALIGCEKEILFIVQDAGETQALLPLLEKIEGDFAVLAGGVAKEQLSKIASLQGKVVLYSDIGVLTAVDKAFGRSQKLSSKEVELITKALTAKKVVSGVAFEMHGQLLEAFAAQGSQTFAYWDNINPSGSDPYFAVAAKVARVAKTLLAPTKAFLPLHPNAVVVGQPSLEIWSEKLKSIDANAIQAKIPSLKGKPVILFIGGYGAEYEEALDLFAKALPSLSGYDVLLSYHPKTGGSLEKEKSAGLGHVHLLQGATTQEAAAIASFVVCHQSTAGVQAAASGKRVLYLIPASQSYTNPLIEAKFTPCCRSEKEFLAALKEKSESSEDAFTILGMPKGATELLLEALKS